MSFVDECRREWRRLGVPAAVADEMAAELAADLEEAEAEGATADDVLGAAASDPRALAAAWAAEQGVFEPRGGLLRRWRLIFAIAAFAIVAIVGAALVVAAVPSGRRVDIPPPSPSSARAVWVTSQTFDVSGTTLPRSGGRAVTLVLDPEPAARAVWVSVGDAHAGLRDSGVALLVLGLAGVVLSTGLWTWRGTGRGSPRGYY